jgi:hypothetical protein
MPWILGSVVHRIQNEDHGPGRPPTYSARYPHHVHSPYSNRDFERTDLISFVRYYREAVITGQVKACIMCLKMPRGSVDHFCSKACREAALSQ